jgi:hypothetical protein
LIDAVLEYKQTHSIDIVESFHFRKVYVDPMHEANGAYPPRNVRVHEKCWHYEETATMVYKNCLFTDSLGSISGILNYYIINVKRPRDE